MHWSSSLLWNTPTAIGAPPSTTTFSLLSATAQAGVGFVDNNSCTVLRIRGQLQFFSTAAAGNIVQIVGGIIVAPVTAAGALDTADFDPNPQANTNKSWMWMFSTFCGKNASGFGPETVTLEVDVKSKRRMMEQGLAVVFRTVSVQGAAPAVDYIPNLRVLYSRLG